MTLKIKNIQLAIIYGWSAGKEVRYLKMANNKSNGWHRRNGSPVPEWFKEHIEWMKSNVKRLDKRIEISEERLDKAEKDLAISKIEAKVAIATAEKFGVDVTELKKKLKMI